MHGVELAYIITSMLELLHLKNVVLVKDMQIDFSDGFNVLTGETGAGKSIIIKSLELLAGAQASESVIHPEESVAFIEATFYMKDPPAAIREYFDDQRLVVSRRIFRGRPTINKLNYESVSLKIVKAVMAHLIFLTAQHQVLELMDSTNHMGMYDEFIGNEMKMLQAAYSLEFKTYRKLKQQFDKRDQSNSVIKAELNDLQLMSDDIHDQNFTVEEEIELLSQQKQCNDLNERRQLIGQALGMANDAISSVGNLDKALLMLSQLSDKPVSFDGMNVLEELNQLVQTITNERLEVEYLESIDIDEVNARLHHIFQYRSKYRVNSLPELLDLQQKANERLAEIKDTLLTKDHLEKDLLDQAKKVAALAEELTNLRKKHMSTFQYVVTNQLKQLGMLHAQFKLDFEKLSDFSDHGWDLISFMFSANPNMPAQPLKNCASGGEMSRIMLALLVTNNGVLRQPLVVFDEIDVGIGGITANYIGTALEKMAAHLQLIVVTHLPQIARCAKQHFKILKTIKNNESCVSIHLLNKKDVSVELQRMVGGDIVASLIK